MSSKCNYCTNEVEESKLFSGQDVNICYECIQSLNNMIKIAKSDHQLNNQDEEPKDLESIQDLLDPYKPQKIIDYLNQYIIGQEDAKEVMAISFYNHFKRILLNDDEVYKSNVLLAGPSGCGKTLITSKISELLDLPFVAVDATQFTESGYIGSDVEDVLTQLLIKSGGNVQEAEKGIVHIDEWDKLAEISKGTQTVNKKGVQNAFLKMIEGGDFFVSTTLNKKDMETQKVKINTKNILFICSGAFEDIYSVIKKRLNLTKNIGFVSHNHTEDKDYSLIKEAEDIDFIKFGMTKEIIARLSFKTYVQELSKDDMIKIIKEPKDSVLNGYKKLLQLDQAELIFEDDAIEEIADMAISKNIGARAIRSIMDNKLREVILNASTHNKKVSFRIDREYLKGNKKINEITI